MPEPAFVDGRETVRETLDEVTTASRRPDANNRGRNKDDDNGNEQRDERDDEVLTLNSCGHAFHSRCLASWFLMERFDCPVCRVVYYERRHSRSRPPVSMVPSVYFGARRGDGLRMVGY